MISHVSLKKKKLKANFSPENSVQKKDLRTYLSYFAKKKFVNFRFSKSIQAAELVEPGYFDPASSYGIASGWGDTRSGGQISNVLLEVRVEIWSNAECSNQYEKIGDTILDTMLCAGSPGRDTCQVKIYVGQPMDLY